MQKCMSCGAEKEFSVLEVYPYPEDDRLCTDPIEPLFVLECQGRDEFKGIWKACVVCHECFHKLDPDMWISSNCWASLKPQTLFQDLPAMVHHENPGRWKPETYLNVGDSFKEQSS